MPPNLPSDLIPPSVSPLSIEQRRRKIVPCIYKRCILPPQLNFYFSLHYENRGKLFNFWDKLQQSIQSPDNYSSATMSTVGVISPKVAITEIDSVNRVETVREAAGPLMFPPPPKLRAGSSMFDLTTVSGDGDPQRATPPPLHLKQGTSKKSPSSLLSRFRLGEKDKSKSFWDLSPSKVPANISLVNTANDSPLTPDDQQHVAAATTKKQKWYKKILTPKSHEKRASGETTPTSSRSFNSELYLGPPVENGAIGEEAGYKKKKKKKLLAW